MPTFDPRGQVLHSERILDDGEWPNFHDAEVHFLHIWRGDVRPEGNVWIGPVIEATFELCALKNPYLAVLQFHDCEAIRLKEFNHQNALYDLRFGLEPRGFLNNGEPLAPYICVTFEQAFGASLTFKCFRVEAIGRKEIRGKG